eukprot:6057121-Pyramimonas_sp.AAC.1
MEASKEVRVPTPPRRPVPRPPPPPRMSIPMEVEVHASEEMEEAQPLPAPPPPPRRAGTPPRRYKSQLTGEWGPCTRWSATSSSATRLA